MNDLQSYSNDSNIPKEADWRSEPWLLDTPVAYENFFNKSFKEAVLLFKDNALYYQEDVFWMPVACLPFYMRAYMAYLMSSESKDDSSGADSFFGLVDFRLNEIKVNEALNATSLVCLSHLSSRQEFYSADNSIFGSFSEKAQRLMRKLGSK